MKFLALSVKKTIRVLGTSLGVFLICSPAFSQGQTGRIIGSVTDQTGGAMAAATVTVTDTLRGTSRTLTTDDAGVVTSGFGCGCSTPDQATGEPVTGTGGNRAIQLGLKLIF